MLCKFRDQDDTTEQAWGSKRMIYMFRDGHHATCEQVWRPPIDFTFTFYFQRSRLHGGDMNNRKSVWA